MLNERLVAIGAILRDLREETTDLRTQYVLMVAIAEIVPDMAPMTAAWIVPMLRDKAYSADCRGASSLAASLYEAAGKLDSAWRN